jgi:hypothetical protein
MNILIPSYLKVSRKLPRANPLLWTNNNSNTNSLQSTIIFRTIWKLIILLLFFFVVAMIVVWWKMKNVPPLLYELLECSHALLDHTLVFQRKKHLGLFSVQTHIQMLTYGCLEGLFDVVYTIVTKSWNCLQQCYCSSSSSG